MLCPHCQAVCNASAKFCYACGKNLAVPTPTALPTCPNCQTANPTAAKFCKKCGQSLNASPLQPPPIEAAPVLPATVTEGNALINSRLVCILGAPQGMSFRVGDGVVIGRSSEANIVSADDREVSKKHAWVGIIAGQLIVRDLGSTNGTFVNDNLSVPIKECELKDGDIIVLGRHNGLKFRVTSS